MDRMQILGKQSVAFETPVRLQGWASSVGKKEGEGPLGHCFDQVTEDPKMGMKTWEEAESQLQKQAAQTAVKKAGLEMEDIRMIFAGDLLASVFSGEAQVIAFAHDYLKAYAINCLLTAILFCFIGYFNGCGKTVFVMAQGVFGAFCVRIPAVYWMSRLEGASLFHIGLGTPISSVA